MEPNRLGCATHLILLGSYALDVVVVNDLWCNLTNPDLLPIYRANLILCLLQTSHFFYLGSLPRILLVLICNQRVQLLPPDFEKELQVDQAVLVGLLLANVKLSQHFFVQNYIWPCVVLWVLSQFFVCLISSHGTDCFYFVYFDASLFLAIDPTLYGH